MTSTPPSATSIAGAETATAATTTTRNKERKTGKLNNNSTINKTNTVLKLFSLKLNLHVLRRQLRHIHCHNRRSTYRILYPVSSILDKTSDSVQVPSQISVNAKLPML